MERTGKGTETIMLKIAEQQKPGSLTLEGDGGIYRLEPVGDDIIRCVYTILGEIREDSELVRRPQKGPGKFEVQKTQDGWELLTQKLAVSIERETGAVSYRKADGELLLRERGREAEKKTLVRYTTGGEAPVIERVRTIDGERNFIKNLKAEAAGFASKGKIHFALEKDEGIFGFGQAEEGIADYRYADQYLYQHNMRIPMPFFLSTKGYGLLADCGSVMTWHGGKEDSYLFLDTVYQLDTYLIAGDCADEIIGKYRMLTGKAAMLPRWMFGYIQSKEMYGSAQELLDVVKEYRRRDVPLDCVVQDWQSWKPGHWGEKSLDPERYGDAREKLDEIHRLGAHTMISVWPTAAKGTRDYEQFLEKGWLLNDCSTYDAFSEDARRLYWEQAEEGLFSKGFDSWWCDSTEPFTGKDWCGSMKREPWERYSLVAEEHKTFLPPEKSNLYAREHAKGIYENQRRTTQEKRVVNLTRSGYAGSQQYGAVLWSGDISASWKTMRTQLTEGLQMGMSGYPYWTLDIGGFFTVHKNWKHRGCGGSANPNMLWFWQGDFEEGADDLGYRELYTRWLEFGVFLPVFRSHGTDTPREIWRFGEPGEMFYDAIASFIRLRYRLMPYIYSMAARVHFEDYTMMRSLLFDFPEDERARGASDGYMFGDALLVYPVTEPMYYGRNSRKLDREKKKRCYLPKGSGWYDFWTNRFFEGGQYVDADAPLEKLPVFVRAGSILPMIEPVSYADEAAGKELTLNVYTGADAEFSYYEDNGDGYGYEKGEYARTRFVYREAGGRLAGEERKGSYPGMRELSYTVNYIRHGEE